VCGGEEVLFSADGDDGDSLPPGGGGDKLLWLSDKVKRLL